MPGAALTVIPRTHMLRPLGGPALAFRARQGWLDRGGHARGDLVLNPENVGQLAIVTFRPKMGAGSGFDELGGDAHPLPCLAHATLEHVSNVEFALHLVQVDGPSFVSKCRITGNDEKPTPFRQGCDDVLSDAVYKISLIGISAHVLKGHNGNCWPVEERERRDGSSGRSGPRTPHPNWLRDVLHCVLACEYEACSDLASDLVVDGLGDAHATSLC